MNGFNPIYSLIPAVNVLIHQLSSLHTILHHVYFRDGHTRQKEFESNRSPSRLHLADSGTRNIWTSSLLHFGTMMRLGMDLGGRIVSFIWLRLSSKSYRVRGLVPLKCPASRVLQEALDLLSLRTSQMIISLLQKYLHLTRITSYEFYP